MKVWFIPLSGIDPNDEDAHEHIDHYVQSGILSTDHAASSYGLPVIVGEDGTVYGPGDIYDGNWSGDVGAPRDLALEAAAAAAGFILERNQAQSETTY